MIHRAEFSLIYASNNKNDSDHLVLFTLSLHAMMNTASTTFCSSAWQSLAEAAEGWVSRLLSLDATLDEVASDRPDSFILFFFHILFCHFSSFSCICKNLMKT